MQRLRNFRMATIQFLTAGLTLLVLLAGACAAADPAAPASTQDSGKLTWVVASLGNERFTNNFGAGAVDSYARILHGMLISTNEKTELRPGIASKWEVSADGKTWTFTIRDGAKFHDGKDLTAQDVWWTWMHYWGKDASGSAVERAINSGFQAQARNAERFEFIPPNQVSISIKLPDSGFPARVSEAGSGSAGVLPARPRVHDSSQEEAYERNPIGAGVARLVKHVPAELMAFERFDDYYYQPMNGLPEDRRLKFKFLDLRLIPEEATRVAAIRTGEADISQVSLVTRKQVEAGGGHLVFGAEGALFEALPMGCYKAQHPCHDKRVRQALDLAIDKTVIRDRLFGGPEVFQVKGWTNVTPSSIGYSPDLDPRPQDVAKARQLLADAGYPGGKGFGKLVVNTWGSAGMPFLPESAQLAADFWRRELGLDVEVKVGDEAALKSAFLTDELHGQIRWGDNEGRLDPSGLYGSKYGTPGHGRRLHEDPMLYELVNQTLAVFDPTKRSDAFNKLHKQLREENYELSIGFVNIPWALGSRVAWQPWPLSFYLSNPHGITLK